MAQSRWVLPRHVREEGVDWLWAILALLIVAVVSAADRPAPTRRTIDARGVVLRDRQGRRRAELGVTDNAEPSLNLIHPSDADQFSLIVRPQGPAMGINHPSLVSGAGLWLMEKEGAGISLVSPRQSCGYSARALSSGEIGEIHQGLPGKGYVRRFVQDSDYAIPMVVRADQSVAASDMVQNGQIALRRYGLDGRLRLIYSAYTNASYGVSIMSDREKSIASIGVTARGGPRFYLGDSKDRLRVYARIERGGSPGLTLLNEKDQVRTELLVESGNTPALTFCDPGGFRVMVFYVTPLGFPGLQLLDRKEASRFMQKASNDAQRQRTLRLEEGAEGPRSEPSDPFPHGSRKGMETAETPAYSLRTGLANPRRAEPCE